MHTSGDKMQQKTVCLSIDLISRADAAANDLNMGFGQLIREALLQYLDQIEKELAERDLGKACQDFRQFNREYAHEWSQLETAI